VSAVQVVAFAPDLMDRSRISAAAPTARFARTPAELPDLAEEAGADVVLIDLGRPGVLDVVAAVAAPVVGFGSHVDRDVLAAARAAGCDEVLARSAFFGGLAARLADGGAARPPDPGAP
jgi:DNA-binding NarL/FixJ family response regulator